MLRITSLSQTDEETVLRIEGRITGADVVLVDREIRVGLERVQRLVLDLKGLKHIDREGLDLLKRWSGETVVLQGCSPFVRALMVKHGLSGDFD